MLKSLSFLFGLFVSPFLFSQILTVNSGASISIDPGSSVEVGGLELAPAVSTYTIAGPNAISRSATAQTSGGNTSIKRVFSSSAALSGFIGTLTFHYLEGDLNGIDEGDLALELQADNGTWTTYNATLNPTNNTLSFTFDQAVSFSSVTASSSQATLTIEKIDQISRIIVFPNPTANRIYIQGEIILQAKLFDLTGRKIITTNQKQIDLANIPNGSYILQVTTKKNKTQSFKIIKQ